MDAKQIRKLIAGHLGCSDELIGVVVGEALCIVALPDGALPRAAELQQKLYVQYKSIHTQFPNFRFI